MADWILVPCLVSLRTEFNRLAPDRGKASDGALGDASHAASPSDHNPDETGRTPYEDSDRVNEVHAIDVDKDLRKPGWTMARCVGVIVKRHREGRDDRLQNVIYQRRIWSRTWGWTARAYTGANPHTGHAHFSARYTAAQERDTSPWGLLEEDDVTKSEFIAWMTEWARSTAGREALARAVLTYDPGKDASGKVLPGGIVNPGPDAASNPTVGAAWALNRAIVASLVGHQIRDRVDQVQAGVEALLRGGPTPPPVGAQVTARSALDAIGSGALTAEETAEALRSALGADRAAQVGRLLGG
ncbi:hypothetical protein [Couchioplanes caeruleus]|uniref:Uncharacterized protein n=2 Tax=Couchioplanes caeruleus TaxID=56438 RepID=A0A1K0FNA7_9ACTN|nr:hypothetical protein [Couchioplanes caeruleus]OJF14317.1 hypothetical protein BG844_10330 [Couchioplanes caeruleus subsp. caeruleus]ROP32860.1 hypothetical protein EDD30_5813 [Couchioplanes caeruleus]